MNQQDDPVSTLILRAWRDEAFKKRLIADPAAAIKEAGLELPPDVSLTVLEETDTQRYLVLPAKPEGGTLSDEALEGVTGGASFVVPYIPLTPLPSPQPTGGPLDQLARSLREAIQPRPDALL